MTRHLITGVGLLSLLAFTTATAAIGAPLANGGGVIVAPADAASPDSPAQKKGRYKKDGDRCVWVSTEDGDNQCTPKGRWKKDGDRCYFDAKDEGPDQCTPPKPR